jgi:hypothetical protein
MAFDISMGVRPADRQLLTDLNRAIARNRREIHRILAGFGVPLLNSSEAVESTGR